MRPPRRVLHGPPVFWANSAAQVWGAVSRELSPQNRSDPILAFPSKDLLDAAPFLAAQQPLCLNHQLHPPKPQYPLLGLPMAPSRGQSRAVWWWQEGGFCHSHRAASSARGTREPTVEAGLDQALFLRPSQLQVPDRKQAISFCLSFPALFPASLAGRWESEVLSQTPQLLLEVSRGFGMWRTEPPKTPRVHSEPSRRRQLKELNRKTGFFCFCSGDYTGLGN